MGQTLLHGPKPGVSALTLCSHRAVILCSEHSCFGKGSLRPLNLDHPVAASPKAAGKIEAHPEKRRARGTQHP